MWCALTVGQSYAQDTHLITLNQSNPSAQMSITMPENSTGVVVINVSNASVQLTDTNNNVVFSSADPRVHLVELSIASNTGAHLLTVQPLPGVDTAMLQVSSQPDLTPTGTASVVAASSIGFQQSQALSLTIANPGGNVTLTIPKDTTGVVTATFAGATATAEVTDGGGMVVASSNHDIDGFNLVLDGGGYKFSLLANGLDHPITASVRVMPANQFSLLSVAQAPAPTVAIPPCTATITASSANLRSGPGKNFTVLNFGYLGDTFTVGGVSPDKNWLFVSSDQGSVWLSSTLVQLNGDCTNLKVVNASFGHP